MPNRRSIPAFTVSSGRISALSKKPITQSLLARYPRLKDKPLYEPQGIRGDGPARAARYWGLTPAGILRPR